MDFLNQNPVDAKSDHTKLIHVVSTRCETFILSIKYKPSVFILYKLPGFKNAPIGHFL